MQHLIVGQESALSSKRSGLSCSRSGSIQSVFFRVPERERLSVQRHAQDNFGWIGAQSDPVIERVVGIKIGHLRFGMETEWRHVTCFLVPVAVVIVRHDANPVQVARNGRNVISGVDDRLGWRYGRRQEPSVRLESHSQFADERCESVLV